VGRPNVVDAWGFVGYCCEVTLKKRMKALKAARHLARTALLVLMINALGVSAAQAGFGSTSYPTTISGYQISAKITGVSTSQHEASTKAGVWRCGTASILSSSFSEAVGSLTLTPVFEKCTLAGLPAIVTVNGCDLHLTFVEGKSADTAELKADLGCPPGSLIEVSLVGSPCKITYATQTLAGIESHNRTTDVRATFDIQGITYAINEGSKCPGKPSNGFYSDGTYTGVATLQGTNGPFSVDTAPGETHFVSAAYPAAVAGNQISGVPPSQHQVATKAGTLKCNTVSFAGPTINETVASLTLAPTYENCTVAGLAATVKVNGCDFTLALVEGTTEITSDLLVHLGCPEGDVLEIGVVGLACKITYAPQTLEGIESHDEATDVKATFDIEGIEYTIYEGSKCPNKPASGTYADGTYVGLSTLQGSNGGFAVG
jgi:hypothetical protein